MVRLGYSVLHTDIDVVWLRSPEPYLMCSGEASRPGGEHGPGSRFECGPLLSADVAVSSDNMSPGRDTEGGGSLSAVPCPGHVHHPSPDPSPGTPRRPRVLLCGRNLQHGRDPPPPLSSRRE